MQSIRHIRTSMNDSNLGQFGSAMGALENLARGMDFAFNVFPNLEFLIVLEVRLFVYSFQDDVALSRDSLEFFQKSMSMMDADPSITLSTAAFFLGTDHSQYDW